MKSESTGIAIVTGSAGALGRAIVSHLAEDGYDIALNDVAKNNGALESLAEDVRKKGRKAIVVIGDVTVENDVKNLVETTTEKLGGLDVMVANAGIYNGGPFLETTLDDFEKIFAVNVRGVYLCFRYAAEKMIEQGRGGRLLAASSIAGETGGSFVTLYGSTKWAVRGLVTNIAKEVGRHGITVNAYAPGVIGNTPMWEGIRAKLAEARGFQNLEAFDAAVAADTPVGYSGKPEDVANLVSFLVKKESHFITGQTMSVNGGRFVK